MTTNRALLVERARGRGISAAARWRRIFSRRVASSCHSASPQPAAVDAVLAAAVVRHPRARGGDALWADSRGWRLGAPPCSAWAFGGAQRGHRAGGAGSLPRARGAGGRISTACSSRRGCAIAATWKSTGKCSACASSSRAAGAASVPRRPARRRCAVGAPRMRLQVSAAAEQGSLLTPLPGTIVAVHVAHGPASRAGRAVGDGRGDENGAHPDRAV